jgi:hypothetical protein
MIKSSEFQRSDHRLHKTPIILLFAAIPAGAFAAPVTLTAATAEKMIAARLFSVCTGTSPCRQRLGP